MGSDHVSCKIEKGLLQITDKYNRLISFHEKGGHFSYELA